MKNGRRRTDPAFAAWLLALAVAAAPGGRAARAENPPSDQAHASIIEHWPDRPRVIIRAMTAKYGMPNRLNQIEVVWYDNGPWRRTVIHRYSSLGFFGARENDYLEQTIGCRIPDDKVSALKRFGKRIDIVRSGNELSSRAESESMNFLALNLAGEIIAGTRSAKDARDFYRKTEELSKSGKTSAYLEEFVLPVEHGRLEFH